MHVCEREREWEELRCWDKLMRTQAQIVKGSKRGRQWGGTFMLKLGMKQPCLVWAHPNIHFHRCTDKISSLPTAKAKEVKILNVLRQPARRLTIQHKRLCPEVMVTDDSRYHLIKIDVNQIPDSPWANECFLALPPSSYQRIMGLCSSSL